ncbi:MAG: glutaminyl-peptide cyclotransferase [Pyrinomonadaceae bacterium]
MLWLIMAFAACQQKAAVSQQQTTAAATTTAASAPEIKGSTPATYDRNRVAYYTFEVVNAYPHDPTAFTQGLEFHDGYLYESTGRNASSSVRKVELTTGKVLQKRDVASQYFAEGLTVLGSRIYQLTWQSNKGFIYDLETFKPVKEFSYRGEGWGLTHNDEFLILSDGTNQIRFLDPASLTVKKTINVTDRGMPLSEINELEFINGVIYANVWQTDQVVQIDPDTGKILGWVNLANLLPRGDVPTDTEAVLNGIAHDPQNDRLFITGKLWPKLFEIRLKSR